MNKQCKQCSAVKPLEEFARKSSTKRDGRAAICKPCEAVRREEYRKRVRHTAEYRQKAVKHSERWRMDGRAAEATQRTASKNPERYKARAALRFAVYSGKITKQPCVVCADAHTHGHHEDYNKPLVVIWLCSLHHGQRHIEINRGVNLVDGFLNHLTSTNATNAETKTMTTTTRRRRQLAIDRKRAEADSLIRLAMRLENITPNVQMAMYEPRIAILVETAIRLQDEANQLESN